MMNQEDIFKKIGQILNELHDQYEYLAQNPQELSELELELFLANANFLSDHVQIVRKLNNSKPLKELPEHTERPLFEPEENTPLTGHQEPAPEAVSHHEAAPDLEHIEREELQQEDIPKVQAESDFFKIDNSPSTFEFILHDNASPAKFDFEEKPVEEIFDRPLSDEEASILAQKKRFLDGQPGANAEEAEDELGPEPFLVSEQAELIPDKIEEKVVQPPTKEPVVDKVEEKIVLSPATEPAIERPVSEAPVAAQPIPQRPAAEEAAPQVVPQTRPLNNIEQMNDPIAPKLTLNEILAGKAASGNVNEGSNKVAITDLKKAINLNEKLLYIKDLFNGYSLAYSEAIDLINKMPDFRTAEGFLKNNYAEKNNWEAKQTTVDKFYELLKQRFQD